MPIRCWCKTRILIIGSRRPRERPSVAAVIYFYSYPASILLPPSSSCSILLFFRSSPTPSITFTERRVCCPQQKGSTLMDAFSGSSPSLPVVLPLSFSHPSLCMPRVHNSPRNALPFFFTALCPCSDFVFFFFYPLSYCSITFVFTPLQSLLAVWYQAKNKNQKNKTKQHSQSDLPFLSLCRLEMSMRALRVCATALWLSLL